MAGALAQAFDGTGVSSGTTVAVTATLTGSAASAVVCAVTNDTSTASTITCGDPTNGATSYVLQDDVTDTGDGQRMATFAKANSTASGSVIVTATWSSAEAFKALSVCDCTGVAGGLDQHAMNYQPTPTTGTDAQTSGNTPTLNAIAASGALVVAFGFNVGNVSAPSQGSTGWSPPVSGVATWWSFGGPLTLRVEYKRVTATTAVAGLFTATSNTGALTGVVVVDETAAAGVSTLANENLPRHPPAPAIAGRQVETWSAQPLGSSQPIKSFLATEGMDRRPQQPPRHTSTPWTLSGIAAPAVGAWFDLAPLARDPPAIPPRLLEPGLSLRSLGVSSPVQTFLHQHPAAAPPWRGPRPEQQPWVGAPITTVLPAMLVNDEAQVIQPRRYRSWAPMGALARTAPSTEIFPLAPDATGRFMVNALGAPFPILGRTAWGVMSLSASDLALFLDDCVARGFTAIECEIPTRAPAMNLRPTDNAGNLPFLKTIGGATWSGTLAWSGNSNAPDLNTFNPLYWANVDALITACRVRGLLVIPFFAYLGQGGGNSAEGWIDELNAMIAVNGDPSLNAYGATIATRYKSYPNILYGTAGDTASGFDPENDTTIGIQSVSGQRSGPLFTSQRAGGSISTDGSGALGLSTSVNGAYDWATAIAQCRRAYAFGTTTRALPSILIEEPYELEGSDGTGVNTLATEPTRRWEWWGIIETIGGYVAGNGYIWPFQTSGSPPPSAQDNWKNHLADPQTQSIALLHAFWKSIAWWTLIPSGQSTMGTLITAGGGTVDNDNYVAAACNPAGSLLLAYAGPSRASTFTVDMTVMRGTATAQWFNPSTGALTSAGSIANTGTHTFTVPGNNGSGFSDWALVMTA